MIWDRAGERHPEPLAHPGRGGLPARAAHPDLQEQHRLQGQLLRHPRELPDGPQGAVRPHRPVPAALLREPADLQRARARWGRRTAPSTASSRSPSAPTSSRPRWGSRRCTAAPSSTPATSRTPTPRSTAGSTSSSGDANMSEVSTYLKCGTMAIVLSMIEDDFIDRDLSLDSPVLAYRRVSRDLACRETMRLKDGRALTAVDLQREFLDLAHRYYRDARARALGGRRAGALGLGARPARRRSHEPRPRARLGHQAAAHRELHGQARPASGRTPGWR